MNKTSMRIQCVRAKHASPGSPPAVFDSREIEILSDSGEPLWWIKLDDEGAIQIRASYACQHEGVLLDDDLKIVPICSNAIRLEHSVIRGAGE